MKAILGHVHANNLAEKKHTDIEKKNTDLMVWIYSGKCMLIVAKRSIKVELQQGGQKKVR